MMSNITFMADVDVLIIGAGAAGLTAAYDIHYDTNASYAILEASKGHGGRLQKLEGFADFPIDKGGEWIHVDPEVLNNITADPMELATDDIQTIPYVDTYDEWDDGEWVTLPLGDKDNKFVNYTWYDFFTDYIASSVMGNLVVDCQVDYVEWGSTPVIVNCADGRQWTANHVIVTVPIKILQDNDITFDPALPASTRDAIHEIYMMPGVKTFMKFENRFYKETFEFATDTTPASTRDDERVFYSGSYGQTTKDNILTCLAVGVLAKRFVNLTAQETLDIILAELDAVYDGQATESFIEGFVQNWNDQIYTRGAYTHVGNDDEVLWDTIGALRKPLANRIFFAGEAIPAFNFEFGFAHGAAFSGRAAATKIAQLLDEDLFTSITRSGDGAIEPDEPSLSNAPDTSGVMAFVKLDVMPLSFGVFVLMLLRNVW